MDCYLIPKSRVKIIELCALKRFVTVSTMLARAHLTYFIIDPFFFFFFFAPGDRGGLALEAPLYNFKTSRDIVSFAATSGEERCVTTLNNGCEGDYS